MTSFDETRVALREAVTAAARLQGRRDVVAQRLEEVRVRVADAKARLLVKDEVRAVLDKMQADAYDKVRGDYERVLTALVSDVLPASPPIALDLYTERNQPALDIVTAKPDGSRGDVYADHGGSLTNVVSTGLRLLAVVKSQGAKFAVLDESDCWIKTEHVPAFYAVVEDAAQRLGLQCFVISHHDVEAFDTDIRVSRLTGRPETGVSIECSARPPVWSDDQDGFRFVRIENFQSYRRAELILSPGVNALTGENDFGKSVIVRAFTAAFYGDTRDSLVRHGERCATVEFGWKNGRFLRFVRNVRGTPKNVWSYHERDGRIVEENGIQHMTGGKSPPEWVDRIFGIVRADGVDVHLPNQKTPTFLLDRPASTRASILSIGREADYVPDMLSIHKEDVTRDQATVRDGEREFAALSQTLSRFEAIDDYVARLALLQDEAHRISERMRDGQADLDARHRHDVTVKAALRQGERAAVFDDMADTSYCEDLTESVAWWSQGCLQLSEHEDLLRRRVRLASLRDGLRTMPAAPPAWQPNDMNEKGLQGLVDAECRRSKATLCLEALDPLPTALPLQKDVAALEVDLFRHESVIRDHQATRDTKAVLQGLPDCSPTLEPLERSQADVAAYRILRAQDHVLRHQRSVFNEMPLLPGLQDTGAMRDAQAIHIRHGDAQAELTQALEHTMSDMSRAQTDLGHVMDCLGHRCPTCGQTANVENLVDQAEWGDRG